MTTGTRGRCTPAPVEVDNAMGVKPELATDAVISTGRSLRLEPARTARLGDHPHRRKRWREADLYKSRIPITRLGSWAAFQATF